jgi:hypothetical protein
MMRVPAIAMAACLAFVPPAYAADEFMDACMLGNSPGSDMPRICTCMSEKVDAKIRGDAIEAMRRSYQSMADTSKSIDPATLPQNLMMGLQAVVLAQADCSSQLTR